MNSTDKLGDFLYPNHKNRAEMEKVIFSPLEMKYPFVTKNKP